MSTSHAERSGILPRPACTPAAIRAVLAASAAADVLLADLLGLRHLAVIVQDQPKLLCG